nr:Rrf2 family transcriptional regulator [Adlercreutzia sp. ZJ141]
MRISTKTRYGMRLMIDLAQHWGAGRVALRDIAERQEISKKYMEQVVAPLVSAGLLHVTRGNQGGYELARDPRQITCADIMTATEDGLGLLDCANGALACPRDSFCLSKDIWLGLERVMADYLASITLQDVLERGADVNMYVI